MSALRCNYCALPATVYFSFMGYLAATRRKWIKVTVSACASHEGCPNWVGVRATHPDSPIVRIGASR